MSRRARGLSIGVNLNADKVCNFDCPYCQVDRTVAGGPADVDVAVLSAELDRLLAWVADGTLWDHAPFDTAAPALRRVSDIAFAGAWSSASCADRVREALAELPFTAVVLHTHDTACPPPKRARACLDAALGPGTEGAGTVWWPVRSAP